MYAVLINILLFSILLIVHFFKNKRITAPSVVLFLYWFVSLGGLYICKNEPQFQSMSVICSMYYFIVVYLFFIPVLKSGIKPQKIVIYETNLFKAFLYFYLFIAIVASIGYLQYILEVLSTGDWLMLKTNAYEGEMNLSNGILDILSRITVSIVNYFIIFYGFYCLTKSDKTIKQSVFWIIVGLVPTLLADLSSAYRGGLAITFLLILFFYLFFSKDILERNKKYITLFLTIISIFLFVFIIAISLSRFDEGFIESIASYFGQSMVNYNYGIASRIDSYSGGKFFLGNLLGLSMDQIMVDSKYGMLTNNGRDLNTFVGILIFDFGFVFTCVISLLVSSFMCKKFKRKSIDAADCLLFVFYLYFITNGVFHFPWNYAQSCLYMLFFYMVLRLSNRQLIV